MPLSDNLLAAYRFSEAGGSTSADEAGSNDLTLEGTSPSLSGGRFICALAGDRAALGSTITLSADWTVAVRIRQNAEGGAGVFCGNRVGSGATICFMFLFGSSNIFRVNISNSNKDFTVTHNMSTDADYLVAYDATADTLSLYVDGSLNETKTSITTGTFNITHLGVGLAADTFSLVGSMDYFYVWERALDSTDAAAVDSDPNSMFSAPAATAPPLFRRSTRFFKGR